MHLWQKIFKTTKEGFPGQVKDEVVEFFTPRHWVVLAPIMFFFMLLALGLIVFDFLWFMVAPPVHPGWIVLINSAFLAVVVHFVFFRSINALMNIMIVTNFRILRVNSTIFLRRERNVIQMKNIQDIEMHQSGLLPRLLNYGDIVVSSASGEIELTFYYVPKTQKIYNIINHICQKVPQTERFDTKEQKQ
jgi:uncharacterized membrane protein YdbT with pleckstrin-like domain